jgi:hypothetical protein
VIASSTYTDCRWEVIYPSDEEPTSASTASSQPQLRKDLTILGELEQLRDALFALYPERKQEYHLRRQSFKHQCLALCGREGHTQLRSQSFVSRKGTSFDTLLGLIWHLTHILSWEPRQTAIHWHVRRAVAYYRLRDFPNAFKDLNDAVDISSKRRGRIDVDALRYRALAREMCHDLEGAQADIDEILKHQQKPDPLAYALRASIKASQGLLDGALADIDRIPQAIQSAQKWQSEVALENFDLVYLAAGWARASVRLQHTERFARQANFVWAIGGALRRSDRRLQSFIASKAFSA